jgi:hypothetical protein
MKTRLICKKCQEEFDTLEEAAEHAKETTHHDFYSPENAFGVCIG